MIHRSGSVTSSARTMSNLHPHKRIVHKYKIIHSISYNDYLEKKDEHNVKTRTSRFTNQNRWQFKRLLERNQTSDLMADSSSPRAFWRESERDIWGDTNIEFYYAPVDGARGKKINKMNVNKVRYSVFLFRRNILPRS